MGLFSFVVALPWFALIFLAYGALPALPTGIPLLAGLGLAGVAFTVINHWAKSPAWGDSSRLALIFGALLASMLAGFLVFWFGGAERVDVVGKLVLNVIAIVFLVGLSNKIQSRPLRS